MTTMTTDLSILGADVVCPYCGHHQYQSLKGPRGHQLVYCFRGDEDDNDGCGKPFAVFWTTKVETICYKLEPLNQPETLE